MIKNFTFGKFGFSKLQINLELNNILIMFKPVHWIHLILMRFRIRILDPHWKKWIRIQVISFTDFFNKKQKFNFFSLIFVLKLDEPFRNQEIFIIHLFVHFVRLFCTSILRPFCVHSGIRHSSFVICHILYNIKN